MRVSARTFVVMAAVAWPAVAAPVADAARSWRPPIELSAPNADAWIGKEVPALSVMPNGTAVVAWRERAGDTSAIKVVEKPPDGPPVGPQTLGGGANPPSVATTLDGRGYVAWVGTTGNDLTGDTVLVAERREGGGYGTPHELATGAQWGLQPGTAVAANSLGDAVVLFTTGSWNNQQLWSARRTRDGEWHEPQPVTEPIAEAVWRLHAGMSETGEAVFAWLSWDYQPDGNSAWTAIEPPDGPAHDVRRMHSPGGGSTMPSLAVDRLGNALVSWTELSSDSSVIVGPVRAAVRAPGQPFGAPIDLGGSTTHWDPSVARLSDDGHAVVMWQGARANGPNGGTMDGAEAAVGTVPAGVFTAPEEVSSSYLVDGPLTSAVDPLGNAAFFWVDWDTGEQRVVRRSVTGLYGRERAVVACPRTRTYPITAAVDPLGNASLLWTESNFLQAAQGMRLSQDESAGTFSPDPCPAPPPPLVWTPKDPAPGESVTLDASGFRDPAAALTTFKWDLDGDGVFETDSGETGTVTYTFADAGEHRIGLQIKEDSQRPGNSSTGTCSYVIRVGSPPDPPNEYPSYWADPRPPDQPDENPWPVAPPVDVPPVDIPPVDVPPVDVPPVETPPADSPPVDVPPAETPPVGSPPPGPRGIDLSTPPVLQLPIGQELGPSPTLLDGPGAGGSAVTVQPQRLGGAGLVVEAAKSIPARTLLDQGMPVRLTSGRTVKVRLRLLRKSGRGSLAAPVRVRIPKGRAVIVRLRPSRTGRRALRSGRVRTLKLEAFAGGHSRVLQRVRLR